MCTIVAPFAGAWIEIVEFPDVSTTPPVAPFAGAWIEITADSDRGSADMSLPSRERGLKYVKHGNYPQAQCRSLRGSVD